MPVRCEAHDGNGSEACVRGRFGSTMVRRATRLLSTPVDSAPGRSDGYSADPARIPHRGKSCVKFPSNWRQKNVKSLRGRGRSERGRGREGTNRRESTGIDRSRVARRVDPGTNRQESTGIELRDEPPQGRIDRSRRESAGIELRAEPPRSRIDRSRQESNLPVRCEALEGSGSGAGGTDLAGPAWNNSIPVDSCRFPSTRLRGRPWRSARRAIRFLSTPADSCRLGSEAARREVRRDATSRRGAATPSSTARRRRRSRWA